MADVKSVYLLVFVLSFILLFILRKVALRICLVDKPSARKCHQGSIPLVGGGSVYLSVLVGMLLFMPMTPRLSLYLGCSGALILLGVLDDRYDISFVGRLVVQTLLALVMLHVGGLGLFHLGGIWGDEVLVLNNVIGSVMTVVAVIGAINTFNMVDGIDGLLGGLASVTFVSLGYLFVNRGDEELAMVCLLIVTAMFPYLLLNMGFPLGRRFKIFMGDAGSMFVGFSVVWVLICGTQELQNMNIRPVTALWLIALPLMDMTAIMCRRIWNGGSPFQADREHFHDLCQRQGLSSHSTLMCICTLAACCAVFGIWGEVANIRETIMFVLFIILFLFYLLVINYLSHKSSTLRLFSQS